MAESVVNRRQALRGAGVAAGGAVGAFALAPAASAQDRGEQGPSGSWLVVRQDDGSPVLTTLVLSFSGGGVFISHDINPAGPPFTGTWKADGRRFRATFWTGQAGNGPNQPGPTIRVRLRGQVEGRSLTGTYTFTVFDPATGAPIQSGAGKVLSGHPIDA
jgi:hypothetical protein